MLQPHPKIEMHPTASLRPYAGNARRHSRKQVRQIAESIKRFGFANPVLIGDDSEIIAGHGRMLAAKELGIAEVPTLRLSHLSAVERRAYVLADNKLALNAGWDQEILAIEPGALIDLGFDVSLTGFSIAEIDFTLEQAKEAKADSVPAAHVIPPLPTRPVTRHAELWQLGRHRLLCGDARSAEDLGRLLDNDRADLVFTDPPYNVEIDGHVCGLGSVRHREFAMASGEMSRAEFTQFLTTTLSNASAVCRDGAIAFVCMDWRHMREMLDAGESWTCRVGSQDIADMSLTSMATTARAMISPSAMAAPVGSLKSRPPKREKPFLAYDRAWPERDSPSRGLSSR